LAICGIGTGVIDPSAVDTPGYFCDDSLFRIDQGVASTCHRLAMARTQAAPVISLDSTKLFL
jgi:hypothetical protein